LNEIVKRTLALRSYELRVENILVECDLAASLPETMADPYQLQQVVLNLLMNAEQALLQGRGQGHVWIRTYSASGNRIAFEISDDGPGIPPTIASRIRKPPWFGCNIQCGIARASDGRGRKNRGPTSDSRTLKPEFARPDPRGGR
jgi:C4-dicarboxylate-specific signal transduction histidine kinase